MQVKQALSHIVHNVPPHMVAACVAIQLMSDSALSNKLQQVGVGESLF